MILHYFRLEENLRKEQRYRFLDEHQHIGNINWKIIHPDENHTWLTEGLQDDWKDLVPMGTKEGKQATGEVKCVFRLYSGGVKTNRDAWTYNFDSFELQNNIIKMINTYNSELNRWRSNSDKQINLDNFVTNDSTKITWDGTLKNDLVKDKTAKFIESKLRNAIYRPFSKRFLYFDRMLNNSVYQFPKIFPTPETEQENRVIWLKVGSEIPMYALMANLICDLLPQSGSQCFPFYTYDEDGTNRKENITDWVLAEFRQRYCPHPPTPSPEGRGGEEGGDGTPPLHPSRRGNPPRLPSCSPLQSGEGLGVRAIAKWDIFYYVYAILHHPDYRTRYAANLKRELPRIPFVPDFWAFSEAGKRLAEIHVNYEQQPEYPLEKIENEKIPFSWRVQRMRLSQDKTTIIYNDSLTLKGIPPETFEYKLGNRSALHWIVDQYQIKADSRSGITNDSNNLDDPEYIVRLIGQVITVSLETVKIVKGLPELGLPKN